VTAEALLDKLRERSRADIQRTPVSDCPACELRRLHESAEWRRHPLAGTGFHRGHGAAPETEPGSTSGSSASSREGEPPRK
jgi:hypothetical protein